MFNVMIKPRGAICNLACAYCYFLSKEHLYPDSSFRMSDSVLKEFTRQYIQAHATLPQVTFAWQGGEPTLMGLQFFRRAVELQKQYAHTGMTIENVLQTNATTLNDEWCDFFRANSFLVGVSLDGPREMHDLYRVDKGSAPTFDRAMHGVELLKKHHVEFNILATVHAANAQHPITVYRFLRDEIGAQFIQFIPIVERADAEDESGGNWVTPRSVSGKQYGDFLIAIFDEWVQCDVGHVFVQIFDVALEVWFGRRAGLCVFAETCGDALALEHNGDVFACDHFVEPRYKLGNIQDQPLLSLVELEQQRAFGRAKRDTLPRVCRECSVRFVCNGGCTKDRILQTTDGTAEPNYLCDGYKAFFTHIDHPMRTMVDLLHRQRAPAEITSLFARAQQNDSCPCGSGIKFKYCHGTNRVLSNRNHSSNL